VCGGHGRVINDHGGRLFRVCAGCSKTRPYDQQSAEAAMQPAHAILHRRGFSLEHRFPLNSITRPFKQRMSERRVVIEKLLNRLPRLVHQAI